MIIPSLDDLIIGDDSEGLIEELGRDFIYAGGWCTAFFLIRTKRDSESSWDKPLLWVHRYQKIQGGWKLMAKVHLTHENQMKALQALLEDLSKYED
ncbi:MAG: hypothetical protein ACO25G_01940 [Holophagaceae bacterium]|jgi:hypothetical protein